MSARQDLQVSNLQYDFSKLQSKVAKQRDEITRLTREVEALRNDLADIKAQRDEYANSLRRMGGP